MEHVAISYGAGTDTGEYVWGAGVIRTTAGSVLSIANSRIRDAMWEGIHATGGGTIGLTNSIISGADRAINGDYAVVNVVNCTLYNNTHRALAPLRNNQRPQHDHQPQPGDGRGEREC